MTQEDEKAKLREHCYQGVEKQVMDEIKKLMKEGDKVYRGVIEFELG